MYIEKEPFIDNWFDSIRSLGQKTMMLNMFKCLYYVVLYGTECVVQLSCPSSSRNV